MIQEPSIAVGLAAVVGVVGMPHGGLDHLFGLAVFEPYVGRWWRATFLLAYLGVAMVVVVGWFAAPAVTIALFFLVSAVHFGDDPTQGGFAPLDGGLIIWVPLIARPSEVATLLSWIVPGGDIEAIRQAVTAARPFLFALAGAFTVQLLVLLGRGHVWAALRPALFAGLFAMLPVLISFGLYFCGWHSLREMIALSRRADPDRPWNGLRTVVRMSALRAGLAVVCTGLAAWYFAADRHLTPVVVQAVFLGLSALAVPHILLHAAARWLGADPFAVEANPCPTAVTT